MVAIKLSNDELAAIAKETPNLDQFFEDLKKSPDFEVEIIEVSGAKIKYHDKSDDE